MESKGEKEEPSQPFKHEETYIKVLILQMTVTKAVNHCSPHLHAGIIV